MSDVFKHLENTIAVHLTDPLEHLHKIAAGKQKAKQGEKNEEINSNLNQRVVYQRKPNHSSLSEAIVGCIYIRKYCKCQY